MQHIRDVLRKLFPMPMVERRHFGLRRLDDREAHQFAQALEAVALAPLEAIDPVMQADLLRMASLKIDQLTDENRRLKQALAGR